MGSLSERFRHFNMDEELHNQGKVKLKCGQKQIKLKVRENKKIVAGDRHERRNPNWVRSRWEM